MMEVFREFTFEAAHWLPNVAPTHKCANVHGHSYRIVVHVRGDIDRFTGWVVDFEVIKKAVQPVVDQLDHRCLNDVPGLQNPTSENLAAWIWEHVTALPLYQVTVQETAHSGVVFRGSQ